jgi:MFS family permease
MTCPVMRLCSTSSVNHRLGWFGYDTVFKRTSDFFIFRNAFGRMGQLRSSSTIGSKMENMCASTASVVRPSVLKRGGPAALAGMATVVSALSIAICAAAMELLWQGLLLASHHISRVDVLSSLLIGLVLAFLVDPLMDRVRHALPWPRRHEAASAGNERNPLFTMFIGIAFAFVSVCLHSALTSFVAGPHGHAGADSKVLAAAVELTAAWAFVPFFVTLAWVSAGNRWAKVPFGFFAIISPLFAGWLFSWAWQTVLITAVPCILILFLGYWQTLKERRRGFSPYARSVICVATIWLAATALVQGVFYLFAIDLFGFNSHLELWIDARFYVGWTLGLVMTPFPFRAGPNGSVDAP